MSVAGVFGRQWAPGQISRKINFNSIQSRFPGRAARRSGYDFLLVRFVFRIKCVLGNIENSKRSNIEKNKYT